MKPTELTKQHVIKAYVEPARRRGEAIVQVRIGNIQKELGWTNRTPSVFSTLSSQDFQQEAGLELIEKKGGPPSGGPSTTWLFVYRLISQKGNIPSPTSLSHRSGGLMALWGICREMYKSEGGGEAFIRSQRENFGSIVPEVMTTPKGETS